MILKEFRELTKDLPDDTVLYISNEAYEWYGVEIMALKGWAIADCDTGKGLIYDFGDYEGAGELIIKGVTK